MTFWLLLHAAGSDSRWSRAGVRRFRCGSAWPGLALVAIYLLNSYALYFHGG